MPRPKRTKVASTITTTTTTRVAKPPKAPAAAPRQQQKATKAPERTENFSDDSDGLVVRSQRPRRRMPWQPEPQNLEDEELTMTGALPVQSAHQGTRILERRETSRVPSSSKPQSTPSSDVSKNSPASNGSANTESQEQSPTENRPAVISIGSGAPLEEDNTTGFGDDFLSFTSFNSDSIAHGTRPPSAMKVGATPAHETSILALTNFKRRARQPSLLRMVHQTTDVEDNELDGLDDLGDLDDLDDFHPEHESTPLNVRRSIHDVVTGEHSELDVSSSGSRGKKRKLSSPVIQVPRSSPPYNPASGADITESRATSPSLPDDVIESREGALQAEEESDPEMNDIMAPPRSSSPPVDEMEDSPDKSGKRRTRGAPRRVGRGRDSDGDELDRPSKSKAKIKTKAHHGISTAKLQSMLPRRRARVPRERDEYDIGDSDEADMTPIDSDQDELQMPQPRRAPAGRKGINSKPNKKPIRILKKSTVPTKITQKNTRTYSRSISSEKENDSAVVVDNDFGDAEEATESSIVLPSTQLKAIAKQFEDVDAWEMDFESVTPNNDNSSPWR